MSDPETVLLIDSWKDQESIDVHHASPMMNTIAELREKYDLHMRAERYISDDESISDADKKFYQKVSKRSSWWFWKELYRSCCHEIFQYRKKASKVWRLFWGKNVTFIHLICR